MTLTREFNDMVRRGQIANMLAARLAHESILEDLDVACRALHIEEDARLEAFWELYEDDTHLPHLPLGEMRARAIEAQVNAA